VNSLHVESPGFLTTVQDLGRPGNGVFGVSASGAADPVALQLGNRLVENPPGAAALEMTLTGGTFVFPEGAIFALSGSDFPATLNRGPIAQWSTYHATRGSKLSVGPTGNGARCYLCVAGGIQVTLFLGSASTHLLSGIGGFHGRALRAGDVLQLRTPSPTANFPRRTIHSDALEKLKPRKILRVREGPQRSWFSNEVYRALFESAFQVTEEANRMGLRLSGPSLAITDHRELISEGTPLGAIQVTPAGQAIILFVEQQTAGGYPKIANVIGADLPSLGQLRPRDSIRFQLVSLEEARAAWLAQQELLQSEKLLFV
jgi:antagonist of KipI